LTLDLDPSLPAVMGDPTHIHQVVVNLVVNAIQAMPTGGRLTLSTFVDEKKACLVVEDTGTGMTEEVAGRVFLPFFTTKDVGQGTGLGLSVVHGIVTSHGGSIELQSTEGVGSRFEVRFPVPADPADENHAPRA
ncbi:MAG: sensor histidine kinase, partial [Vicinamibacteria bacterium]